MSGQAGTKRIKAKIIIGDQSPRWTVRLNPDTSDLLHEGNTLWFLDFNADAVVGAVTAPASQADVGLSTFDLRADATIIESRITTVAEFVGRGRTFAPGDPRPDENPTGTIGDPTSRSSLC